MIAEYSSSINLLQAVNDWQIGSSPARAKKLKVEATSLPDRFKECYDVCFRRLALEPKYLMPLGTTYHLKEKISSWTVDVDVAKKFKGGVPEGNYQGVVFGTVPPEGSVVLNLNLLYQDSHFIEAVKAQKDRIKNYSRGIEKYWGKQKEVVLDIENIPLDAIRFWGGYSSSITELAKMLYMKDNVPTAKIKQFKRQMKKEKITPGVRWLEGPQAVQRVNHKLMFHANRLSSSHSAENV